MDLIDNRGRAFSRDEIKTLFARLRAGKINEPERKDLIARLRRSIRGRYEASLAAEMLSRAKGEGHVVRMPGEQPRQLSSALWAPVLMQLPSTSATKIGRDIGLKPSHVDGVLRRAVRAGLVRRDVVKGRHYGRYCITDAGRVFLEGK